MSLLRSPSANASLTLNIPDRDGFENVWPKPQESSSTVRAEHVVQIKRLLTQPSSVSWHCCYRIDVLESDRSHSGEWCPFYTKPCVWLHLPDWLGFCYRHRIRYHHMCFDFRRVCSTTSKVSEISRRLTLHSHFNPAITICFAVWQGFPWRKVPYYM